MSNPPREPSFGQSPAAGSFARDEWELLTTLPRRVLIAATSAEADSHRRTVAEGLAGIEAIAAGRASDSALVREVVTAIYAEEDADTPTAEEFTDRAAGINQTLAACRHASEVLDTRGTRADAEAYRSWLTDVAAAVCGAARTGGMVGFGGARISVAERRFLDELRDALT
jgi:hypothetical protein